MCGEGHHRNFFGGDRHRYTAVRNRRQMLVRLACQWPKACVTVLAGSARAANSRHRSSSCARTKRRSARLLEAPGQGHVRPSAHVDHVLTNHGTAWGCTEFPVPRRLWRYNRHVAAAHGPVGGIVPLYWCGCRCRNTRANKTQMFTSLENVLRALYLFLTPNNVQPCFVCLETSTPRRGGVLWAKRFLV